MAAKLLHSLADDNPDLQKQIGCMTGIIQIFDRQHFISGRRPNQRKALLPPPPSQGNSRVSNGSLDADSSNVYNRETVERNQNNYLNEKRASTESSRASFSCSSHSSSFSSLDFGGTGQPEPSSMDRIIFPEIPSKDPVISQTSSSPKMGRYSVDLRDVVKDSMHRDSRGSSMQTVTKEEGSSYMAHHRDSPRHLQLPKSVDRSLGVGIDIKECDRARANLRDAQWNYDEQELPRLSCESKDRSSLSVQRDGRRFSYDGREVNERIRDGPRLSLDSRDSSARSTIGDSKSNVQSSPTQSRASSVVAKLMGLDMLPDLKPFSESSLGPIKTSREAQGSPLLPLRVPDACRPVRLPKSPRSSRKDPSSPRWMTADTVMKPVSSSKFPNEPAPWKHVDSGRTSPKQASRQVISSVITSRSSPSVFGEIEKRWKDIEFNQSGKDLRALKQILEAMQGKGFLEVRKDEQSLNLKDRRETDKRVVASRNGGGGTSKAFESPIVIMKPGKLVQKSGIPASSIIPIDGLPSLQRRQSNEGPNYRKNSTGSRITKDPVTRDNRRDQAASSTDRKPNIKNTRATQSSSKSPQAVKESSANSLKSSGSISPRLQQKKLDFDKRSRPPTPPSESIKTRSQPFRNSNESVSPGGGRRRLQKTSSVHPNDEQPTVRDNDTRKSNSAMLSESVSRLESRIDVEEDGAEQSAETASCQRPTVEAVKICRSEEAKEDVSSKLGELYTEADFAVGPEQPSPVSVLDSSVYMEGSPSPVKHTSHTLEDDVTPESNDNHTEDLWSSEDSNPSTNTTNIELPSEINRKKLESIDNLVQKLRRLNSSHDEAQTDYIASLCENTNPDHRYISEILLASGLLLRELCSGLTAFQLHPSGHPINPELFFVLEQTKASSLLAKGDHQADLKSSKPEKFHRKLIFDTVNELLAAKLGLAGPPPEPWFKPEKLARKTLNAQKLLRELCGEIELLQARKQESSVEEEEDELKTVLLEDVMRRSNNWTDFRGDISGIVLDVERSIFKDLVDEIVRGETSPVQGKPNRRRRQLFSK
ncbi:protein LONGIFOLIA 1 [Silene latifolia]|uniref:protein LONGIFOLIA 1 n=1 Tax=Silene latifolia TaxID=37657 RepID=UPI003D78142E